MMDLINTNMFVLFFCVCIWLMFFCAPWDHRQLHEPQLPRIHWKWVRPRVHWQAFLQWVPSFSFFPTPISTWISHAESFEHVQRRLCADPKVVVVLFFCVESFVKQERGVQKRGRGRPPKINRGSDHYSETKKSKHGETPPPNWTSLMIQIAH